MYKTLKKLTSLPRTDWNNATIFIMLKLSIVTVLKQK